MSVFRTDQVVKIKCSGYDEIVEWHLLASPGCAIQFADVGIDPHVLHAVRATLGFGSLCGLGLALGRLGLLLPLLGLRARHLVLKT